MGADGAGLMPSGPSAGLVAYELVDDSSGDAGVFQPGREGVAKVVGAVQVDRLQQGVLGAGQQRPPLRLGVGGGGAGGELGKGAVDGCHPGGAALGLELDRELFGGKGTVVAEDPKDAGGGRPQPGRGWVGELGRGAVVGAAEVVPRQHRAGALLHAGAAALAGAAARPGEQQGGGIAAGREPAADGLDHLGREGDLTDAGVALGRGLKPLPNWLRLIAHIDDLQDWDGLGEVDAAAVQAGELADAQTGTEERTVDVPL